jgi:hypothetical protein
MIISHDHPVSFTPRSPLRDGDVSEQRQEPDPIWPQPMGEGPHLVSKLAAGTFCGNPHGTVWGKKCSACGLPHEGWTKKEMLSAA